jgi:hypothetical protein
MDYLLSPLLLPQAGWQQQPLEKHKILAYFFRIPTID